MGLVGYGFSYKNTKLVELAARERLTGVSFFDVGDILRLEGDICLINCCGGLTRQTVVVVFDDPLGQLSLGAGCYEIPC